MKIKRDNSFKPITIIVESENERKILIEAIFTYHSYISSYSEKTIFINEIYNALSIDSDWINEHNIILEQ